MMLDYLPQGKEVQWKGRAFKKMKNLRILIIKNACFSMGVKDLPNSLRVLDWKRYPSASLPPNFNPTHLAILKLPDSHITFNKPLKACIIST